MGTLSPLTVNHRGPNKSVDRTRSCVPKSIVHKTITKRVLHRSSTSSRRPNNSFRALFISRKTTVFDGTCPAIGKRQSRILPTATIDSGATPNFGTSGKSGKNIFSALVSHFYTRNFNRLCSPGYPASNKQMRPCNNFCDERNGRCRSRSIRAHLLAQINVGHHHSATRRRILCDVRIVGRARGGNGTSTVFDDSVCLRSTRLTRLLTRCLGTGHLHFKNSTSHKLNGIRVRTRIGSCRTSASDQVSTFGGELEGH